MTRASLLLLAACASSPKISPSAPQPFAMQTQSIDTTPKERRRMMPPEVYLRAYLGWFGGLAPLQVQQQAKPKGMFDTWDDYLAALGLPDYKIDLPRQTQSNSLMLATLGRLGEALCARAAEHDFHGAPPKLIFTFDTAAPFADGFDVLHRRFLGYPVRLAPADREPRFQALFEQVAAAHPGKKSGELAWTAVCAALVQHPEAELY